MRKLLDLLVRDGGREYSYYISQRKELGGKRTPLHQKKMNGDFEFLLQSSRDLFFIILWAIT